MSIVIRRSNGDIMWFDAVTQFDLTYQSSVTKHPIATGGYVSDHTTNENLVISLNGVLTNADFNINRPQNLGKLSTFDLTNITIDENGLYKPTDKQYTTNSGAITPVSIKSKSSINKLLPEVIAQFTKDTIPVAVVTSQSRAKTARAVKRELIGMRNRREEFQVLELLDDFVIETYGPCIFTNLSFREDVSTGEGIFPNMTIEEVTFTDLQEVTVKIKTSNKGRKSGAVTKKATEPPPATNATDKTNQASPAPADSSGLNTTTNNLQGN
jgi:GTPase SAR1 family protein